MTKPYAEQFLGLGSVVDCLNYFKINRLTMNLLAKSVFATLILVTGNAYALEEPPGTQSLENAIAEEKKVAAEAEARYQSEYQAYATKPHETAIILMHGKWGSPPAPLDSNFSVQKFYVVSPLMPWAGVSGYDKTYEQALEEINKLVIKLRAQGFKKIIVGGQSFGANGALAYAAVYGDVDGIMLFAPGHNPDIDKNWQPGLVSEAKKNIKEGRPEQLIRFTDFNDGGRQKTIEARSDIFYSYFADDSLANMSKSATKVQASIPTTVYMGNGDYVTRMGSRYFFDRLPSNAKSKYQISSASHREVPLASFDNALDWLKGVMK
jgi:pimeloyl-ACP methyl ester carboxylesterase